MDGHRQRLLPIICNSTVTVLHKFLPKGSLPMLRLRRRTVLIILAVCVVLHSACLLFGYFILPKRRFRKLNVMQNGYNRYVFSDDCIQVHSFGNNYTSQQEIKFGLVTSIAETDRYLIVFCHSMRLALPVDKSTMEGASAEQLVKILTNHGQKRYTRCKY